MSSVLCTTGARLHMGIFSDPRPGGRQFQGAGVMVAQPGYQISVSPSTTSRDIIEVPQRIRSRVTTLITRFRVVRESPQTFHVSIPQEIAPHTGLGSGTQLAFGLVQALARCSADESLTVEETIRITERANRSTLGSMGFFQGGFLIDHGRLATEPAGTVLPDRYEFPKEWRILLITPQSNIGLSGQQEVDAFSRWPQLALTKIDQLREMNNVSLPQAIRTRNYEQFSHLIYNYGQIVGETFAMAQGGIYSSADGTLIEKTLHQQGITGVGQSSWGPTIFAICKSASQADQVLEEFAPLAQQKKWQLTVTHGMNTGAEFKHKPESVIA